MNREILPFNTPSLVEKDENVPNPDPGLLVAQFIAWLKKRGYTQDYDKCERKCRQLGIDLDVDIIDNLGKDIIAVYRSRGKKVIHLKNKTWAQDIACYHGVDIPHHRHHKPW